MDIGSLGYRPELTVLSCIFAAVGNAWYLDTDGFLSLDMNLCWFFCWLLDLVLWAWDVCRDFAGIVDLRNSKKWWVAWRTEHGGRRLILALPPWYSVRDCCLASLRSCTCLLRFATPLPPLSTRTPRSVRRGGTSLALELISFCSRQVSGRVLPHSFQEHA